MKILIILLSLACYCNLAAQNFKKKFDEGKGYMMKGLYAEALSHYTNAEKQKASSGQKMLLWTDMAYCYKQTANYNKSLQCYERLLELLKESPRRNEILLNLSDLYLLTGRYEKVITLLKNLNVSSGEDVRLINLSTAYARIGKIEEALNLLTETQKRHVSTKDSIYTIATSNKGYILWSTKCFEEACQQLNIALPLFNRLSDRYLCMGNLALVEAECGHFEQALTYINECILWQAEHIGETHPDYIVSLRKKAEILLKMNHITEATDMFKVYFNKEKEYVISNFAYMTEQERIDFWNTKKELLAECYTTETNDPDFLFNVALFSKSVLLQANRNFLQLVAKNKDQVALYENIKELRYKLRTTQGNERKQEEKEAERLERQLMRKMETYRTFSNNLKTDANDVRKALKNKTDLTIEFIQYTKADTIRYAALLMQKEKPVRFIPLFTQKEIEHYYLKGKSLLGTLTDAIYSRKDIDKDRIYTDTVLGRKIWQPLLDNIPQKANIYFSPEGIFHLLAIEYLNFDRMDCQLYRLSSTRRLCEKKIARKTSLLLVGGLDYNDTTAVSYHTDTLPDRTASEVLGRDGIPPVVGGDYNYLPGSSTEANSIRMLFPQASCDFLEASKGTEDALKRSMGNHSLIHISTHGFCVDYKIVPPIQYLKDNLSEDLSLSRCGIILSGANRTAKQNPQNEHVEDGILTARELCDLDLSQVDLVTLSACQTGLGRITADGIAGLPRGLKKAGAESILVSLWEVNDRATQIMMCSFYNYLKQGFSKQQALMKAQCDLQNYNQKETKTVSVFSAASQSHTSRQITQISDYNKPCYWAAFILIDGN